MPYVAELLPEEGVIRLTFDGCVAVEDRAEALAALIRLQAVSSFRSVLVDLSNAELADASSAELFDHSSRLAGVPVLRHMRIAYVGDPAPGSGVECLAATKGYFYQRFRSQAAALRWLSAGRLRRAA